MSDLVLRIVRSACEALPRANRSISPSGRLFQHYRPVGIFFGCVHRRYIRILLDPGRFLNRLAIDLILVPPRIIMAAASIDRGESAEERELGATEKSERLAHAINCKVHSFFDLMPLIVLLAVTLSGCGDKP